MDFIDGDEPDDPFDPAQVSATQHRVTNLTQEQDQEVAKLLLRRKEAYTRVFSGSAAGDDVKLVIQDLMQFCRGETSAWDADARVHALLTGRQEVFVRIMDHTRLSLDALLAKYNPPHRG